MSKKEKSLDELYLKALGESPQKDSKKTRGAHGYSPKEDGDDDDEILTGIPRGVYADAWAMEEEEKGESFSGMDLYEIAPETPAYADKWARKTAREIIKLNPKFKNLTELYEFAKSKGYGNDAEHFGYHLGMQSVGHGVSWSDDARAGHHDDIKLPSTEFYIE